MRCRKNKIKFTMNLARKKERTIQYMYIPVLFFSLINKYINSQAGRSYGAQSCYCAVDTVQSFVSFSNPEAN